MKPESVIILTHYRDGKPLHPHTEALHDSNPEVIQHVAPSVDKYSRKLHWKNSDRDLRQWWAENRNSVSGEVILILEWDTLVEIPLPELPENVDLAGAEVYKTGPIDFSTWRPALRRSPKWTPEKWMWWREIKKFPPEVTTYVGLVSFGFMLIRRKYLDAILHPKWDVAFDQDISNELRFPSIVASSGGNVQHLDLPNVHFGGVVLKDPPGIYHPVKKPRHPK